MKSEIPPIPYRYFGVLALFAICGAGSAWYFLDAVGDGQMVPLVPIPFAFLCTALFMRKVRAIFAAPLMLAVWLAAHEAARWLVVWTGRDLPVRYIPVPMFAGGFVGGIGLVLSVSTCYRRFFFDTLPGRRNLCRRSECGRVCAVAAVSLRERE